MKHLLVAGLLAVAATAMGETGVQAQSASLATVHSRSATLTTRPASIDGTGSGGASRPYTTDQLNSALGTLEANPKPKTPTQGNSIESLIEKFAPSNSEPAPIDPIDFFKPPALDGGVKVPIQQ